MPDQSLAAEGESSSTAPSHDHGPTDQDQVGSTPVDVIVHSLRRQHLQSNGDINPSTLRPTSFTRPAHTLPFAPSTLPLEVDPMCVDTPANPTRGLTSTTTRHPARQESNPGAISSSLATQTLVEGVVSSGTQCRVPHPPVPAPANFTARLSFSTPPEHRLRQAHHEMTDNAPREGSTVESFSARSRSGRSRGLERYGLLRYQRSEEVALRCPNLVRRKPRMRRRAKLREKSSMSSIPAASDSTVVSSSSTSA